MEGELKKGTARPLSMGRIGSHFALLPLAVPGSAFQGVYPGTASAFNYYSSLCNSDSSASPNLRHLIRVRLKSYGLDT